MAAADNVKTSTVTEKIRQVAEAVKTAPAKRLYIATVVSRIENGKVFPAPFHAWPVSAKVGPMKTNVVVTFQDETEPFEADPRNPERWVRKQRVGSRVWLSDEEVAAIRVRIGEYAVRWLNRGADRAEIIDCGVDSILATLSSATDEPLAPYLTLELA